MKLRIRGNTLRLRLDQEEVQQLGEQGRLEEAVIFGADPAQRLTYALTVTSETDAVAVDYSPGTITIDLPATIADPWISTGQIGIEATCQSPGAPLLKVQVEKDFAATKPRRGEDDSKAFPNPKARANGQ
jgi:uncharacterized protein DUF7009